MHEIDERLLLVDRHGALRVPGTLWLTLAFLARHWIVLVLAIVSQSAGSVQWLRDISWTALLMELPVVALLFAMWRRRPEASRLWRWLWRCGQQLIVGTAGLHLAYVIWHLVTAPVWRRWPELFLASCALLDLVIIYVIVRDSYFRKLFADYPEL